MIISHTMISAELWHLPPPNPNGSAAKVNNLRQYKQWIHCSACIARRVVQDDVNNMTKRSCCCTVWLLPRMLPPCATVDCAKGCSSSQANAACWSNFHAPVVCNACCAADVGELRLRQPPQCHPKLLECQPLARNKEHEPAYLACGVQCMHTSADPAAAWSKLETM